jgi:hypothetical protein
MVTTIRFITQELDGFASRYANQIEHVYVANRPLSEEIREANEVLAGRIVGAIKNSEMSTVSTEETNHGSQYQPGSKTPAAPLETSADLKPALV